MSDMNDINKRRYALVTAVTLSCTILLVSCSGRYTQQKAKFDTKSKTQIEVSDIEIPKAPDIDIEYTEGGEEVSTLPDEAKGAEEEVAGVVDEPEVEEEETAMEEKEVVEEEPVKQAEEVVVVKTVAEELGVKAVDKTMYTTNALNVRKDATAESEKIGSYGKGSLVKVTGEISNGWVRVNYNNKEGYVSGGYLTGAKPVAKSVEKPKSTSTSKQTSTSTKNTPSSQKSSSSSKPKSNSTQNSKNTGSTSTQGNKKTETPSKPKDPPKSDSGGSWGTYVPLDETTPGVGG